jgi:DNA polymerase V
MGVQSVLDLINANPKEIKKQFSIVMEKTVLELSYLSDDAVAKKQIISSRSYGNQCMKWMT